MTSRANRSLPKRVLRSMWRPSRAAAGRRVFGTRHLPLPIAIAIVLISLPLMSGAASPDSQTDLKPHRITVKFNYDFTAMHACPVKNTAPCVKEFNVYNIMDNGKRILLFTIPAPTGAKHWVRGIGGTSKPLVFAPGQHMIAVTAVANNGTESKHRACTMMVNIN